MSGRLIHVLALVCLLVSHGLGARPALAGGVGVSDGGCRIPARLALHANRPNPFGDGTSIHFDVPRIATVRIDVFDAQGRRVKTLANGSFEAGSHSVVWDGTDQAGRRAAPGVYLCRMESEGFHDQRRMVLLRR